MEKFAQLGLISRAGMVEKKFKDYLVDSRRADGSLIAVHPGVYRFRGAPESWESKALALTMYAGKGTAISHASAAWLHRLEGFNQPSAFDLLVPANVKVKPPGVCVHRTREPFQIYEVDSLIPTTALARTLVDLAPLLKNDALEIALNSAWRKQRTIARWLRHYLGTLRRTDWRSVGPLLEMVNRMDGGGLDSGLEVEVMQILLEAGLPSFEKQVTVHDHGGKKVMRVDFVWPDFKVVLHVDGYSFHSTERAMLRDAQQRSEISVLKWTQIVVMAKTLKKGVWLEQLRRALVPATRAAPAG